MPIDIQPPSDVSPLITVKNLYFSHGKRCVIDRLSLVIRRGQITAIMGPSGTGKTTLLRLLCGQLSPDSGSIQFDGIEVTQLKRKALMSFRHRIGVLFQAGGLFSDLTVFENVAFPLREHTELPAHMVRDLVLLMLEAVGLRGARDLRVDELSGGMVRRVALARAVIFGPPELLLYDEPFTGQDPIVRGVLVQLIKTLNQYLQLTSVIVSHDVPETAALADYVYIIHDGSIIGEGAPKALFADKTPRVKQFIHGLPDGEVSFHYSAKCLQEDLA